MEVPIAARSASDVRERKQTFIGLRELIGQGFKHSHGLGEQASHHPEERNIVRKRGQPRVVGAVCIECFASEPRRLRVIVLRYSHRKQVVKGHTLHLPHSVASSGI
jgi:hypothetical protein